MVYIRLILFSLKQLSLMGLWQSGAEVGGSEILRQRTLRHRRLHEAARQQLIARLVDDLTKAGYLSPTHH